jgi:hypothetical protein
VCWPLHVLGNADQCGIAVANATGLLADGGLADRGPRPAGDEPSVLDDLNTAVPNFYPQVRSVLVIRHGYLVYERYWHGFTASDGHDSRSMTKSFVSALVGIALRDRHICRVWTKPSRICWPTICPPTQIHGCARPP